MLTVSGQEDHAEESLCTGPRKDGVLVLGRSQQTLSAQVLKAIVDIDSDKIEIINDDVKVNRIISPEDEVASAIVNQWRTPGAFDVAEFARSSVTMLGVSCKNDCPILDTPLRNLIDLFPDLSVTVMAIIRGTILIVPRGGDDIILSGDRVYLACPTMQIDRTLKAFGHAEITAEKVTISGAGAIGIRVAEEIHKISPETNLTILELDKDKARHAAETLEYATIISGDSLDPEIIKEARLGQGETYIAATNNDEVNILSSLLAKRSGASHTVALINLPVFIPLFNSLDLEGVVSPPNLTSSSILQEVRSGQIEHVHSIIEEFGEIISFEALKSSSIVGKKLKDIKFIVIHYTGMQSKVASINRLLSNRHKVSCHYLIDQKGIIIKMVEENKVAWHAGKSMWGKNKLLNNFY